MRVAEHVFILSGAIRSACYDTAKGECWPLTEDELQILNTLASGKSPNKITNLPNSEILKIMISMRNRGWLIAGSPKVKNLDLPIYKDPDKPKRLNHVWLELTTSCNLTCAHCYAGSSPLVNRSNELNLEEWIQIVQSVLDFGVDIITFIGGEPTIRLDLAESLAKYVKIKSPQTRLRMFSNFSIASRSKALLNFVKSYGIEIGTAIYGITPESHDQLTTVKGSFNKTLQLIEEMKKEDIDVFVGMYVDLSNPDFEKDCQVWLKSIGLNNFEVIAPSKVGRAVDKTWQNIIKVNSNQKVFNFTQRQLKQAKNGHNCFLDHFVIKSNGDLSPCIMMRKIHYGNIKTLSVTEILNNDEYVKAATLSKDFIDGCSSCEFRYACFDCRPDAMAGTNDLTRKPACGYDPRLPIGALLNG